jgi:hypothetical protein
MSYGKREHAFTTETSGLNPSAGVQGFKPFPEENPLPKLFSKRQDGVSKPASHGRTQDRTIIHSRP